MDKPVLYPSNAEWRYLKEDKVEQEREEIYVEIASGKENFGDLGIDGEGY